MVWRRGLHVSNYLEVRYYIDDFYLDSILGLLGLSQSDSNKTESDDDELHGDVDDPFGRLTNPFN